MWSLQNLLWTLCFALSRVSGAAEQIYVAGYKGREVQVPCPYEKGLEANEKYLCRNNCGDDHDVVIKTTQGKKDRYVIHDDIEKRVFTVTISDLYPTDAGKYWCGMSRLGPDPYSAEVNVEVVPDSCCDRSTKVQGSEKGSVSIRCTYDSKHRNNLKYICRGKQPSTCLQQAVITSDSKRNGRFRLTDDKVARKFTVAVTSLTQEDSGSYLCGVHRNSIMDVFSAVELEVKVVPQQTVTPPITVEPVTSQTTQSSEKPIEDAPPQYSVAVIVPVILAGLLIGTCAFAMAYKRKCCKVRGAGVNVNRNAWITAEEREMFGLAELNELQQVAQRSKRQHDGKRDPHESMYHTLSETQDIYNKYQ